MLRGLLPNAAATVAAIAGESNNNTLLLLLLLLLLLQNDLVLLKLQSAEQACDLSRAAAAHSQLQQQLEQARWVTWLHV
jgi:hypothetical protein